MMSTTPLLQTPAFSKQTVNATLTYTVPPPSLDAVECFLQRESCANNPSLICGDSRDIPERPAEVGGDVLKIGTRLLSDLETYDNKHEGLDHWHLLLGSQHHPSASSCSRDVHFTPVLRPPLHEDVLLWTQTRATLLSAKHKERERKDAPPRQPQPQLMQAERLLKSAAGNPLGSLKKSKLVASTPVVKTPISCFKRGASLEPSSRLKKRKRRLSTAEGSAWSASFGEDGVRALSPVPQAQGRTFAGLNVMPQHQLGGLKCKV